MTGAVEIEILYSARNQEEAGKLRWHRWYRHNIPLAEQLYRDYTGDTED